MERRKREIGDSEGGNGSDGDDGDDDDDDDDDEDDDDVDKDDDEDEKQYTFSKLRIATINSRRDKKTISFSPCLRVCWYSYKATRASMLYGDSLASTFSLYQRKKNKEKDR